MIRRASAHRKYNETDRETIRWDETDVGRDKQFDSLDETVIWRCKCREMGTFVGERANETKFDNSCRKSSQKAQNERMEAERGFD